MWRHKANIYSRKSRLFVAPSDGQIVLEPVLEPADNAAEIGRALKESLARSAPYRGPQRNFRLFKSPVQLAAKVRSPLEFERGLRMLTVTQDDAGYLLQRWIPLQGDRGLNPDPAWDFRPEDPQSFDGLVARLVRALHEAAWPTR